MQDNNIIPNFSHSNEPSSKASIASVYFTPQRVIDRIKKLKNKSSPGCDGMPAVLFKTLASVIATPLSLLYNLSLSSGTVPTCWKSAVVIPIYKKGDPSSPVNYRPIF